MRCVRTLGTWVLVALIVGTSSWLSAGDTPKTGARPIELTGRLEVLQVDDWDGGHSHRLHYLEDPASGVRYTLEGHPASLDGLRSGSTVVVRGTIEGESIRVGLDQNDGVEVIDALGQVAGARTAVILIVDFQDSAVSCSDGQIADGMFTGTQSVDLLYQETSFGLVSFPGDTDLDGQPDVFRISIGASISDSCDHYGWAALAEAAATDAMIDLSLYQHRVLVLPAGVSCSWSGLANIGCGTYCRVWIKSCDLEDVFAHEVGHNLGLSHASTDLDNNDVVDCTYCDVSDFMGYGNQGWRQVNGPHKEVAGWVPAEQVVELTENGTQTFVISSLETDPALAPHPQMIKIASPGTEDFYYLSYRQRIGYDASLSTYYAGRTNIHRHPGSGYNSTLFIESLADGESFDDSSLELNVIQLSHDAATATVQITLNTGGGDPCDGAGDDVDQDGVCGDADNCPDQHNPGQQDGDADGLGDACDSCPLDFDNDADGDGVCAGADNCPSASNADQQDQDGDGKGDACDVCPADPLDDADGDGACGDVDNCPETGNDDQQDSDADGLGDACDDCPTDPLNDPDDDAICGSSDNCPDTYNPVQEDSDGDGFGDACDADDDDDGVEDGLDNCPALVNPAQHDIDGDGLGDLCDPLRVNFAPAGALLAEGYLGDHGEPFDPSSGFGWDLNVVTNDRQTGIPIELDTFATTSEIRRWSAELPNGDYAVHVVSGDASFAQGPHQIEVESAVAIDGLMTEPATFVENTVIVPVRDGRIDLAIGGGAPPPDPGSPGSGSASGKVNFGAVGSTDPDSPLGTGMTTINLVESVLVDGGTEILASVNFQPVGSITPVGYAADTGEPFDALRGYGWDQSVPTLDRFANVPQADDTFAFSAAARVWEFGLSDGVYEIFLVVGDAASASGPHLVSIEGTPVVEGALTGGGEFLRTGSPVHVTDGRLTVGIGGSEGSTNLCQVVVAVAAADADGDGMANEIDNCPASFNPDQTDGDGDGIGDACDACVGSSNADADGDGYCDEVDVCPDHSNADQADADTDGMGDVCDACPLDPSNDVDGDGVCGDADNCPETSNHAQNDSDGDGVGNRCDNCVSSFNPDQTDSDGDGKGDACDSN